MKKNLSEERKGVIALVVLTFGFGLIAIFVRYLSSFFTLFQQLYLTVGFAFLFGFPLFNKKLDFRKFSKIPQRDWLILCLRVVLGYVLGASLYRESLTLTKISNVVFIQSIPITALFGFLLFKEKLTFKKILFLAMAYAGVLLISLKDFSNILSFGLGELFSLISAVCFSFSFLARKWQSNYLNNQEMSQMLFFIGFIILFSISLLLGEPLPSLNWPAITFVAILVIGLLNTINVFLTNYGFEKIPAVLASNILTLESFFAILLAVIFYREFPNLKELFGGTLIVGSVIFMNRLEENKND